MHSWRPASRFALARLLRSLMVPLALALPPLLWVADATRRASLTPLGRDQGIFQYIGWALSRGDRDYRDIRDVNGPLTHLVHRVLLALGGADEHRFRVLDLVITGSTFALVGACLPGLRSPSARRSPEPIERVAWALAAWVVLSGQYLLYGYWDLAQRESFFDWFLLPSVALQLVAQRALASRQGAAPARPGRRAERHPLVRQAHLRALHAGAAPGDRPRRRSRRVAAQGAGRLRRGRRRRGRVAAGGPGRDRRCPRLRPHPALRRARDVPLHLAAGGRRTSSPTPGTPRRPSTEWWGRWCSWRSSCWVRCRDAPSPSPSCRCARWAASSPRPRGSPTTFTRSRRACICSGWSSRRGSPNERASPSGGWHSSASCPSPSPSSSPSASPRRWRTLRYIRAVWLLWGASTAAGRGRLASTSRAFPSRTISPSSCARPRPTCASTPQPTDRVQIYGMDPYVLFLARRLSATPYIYAYDLNADAALGGGTGGRPDDAQVDHIQRSARCARSRSPEAPRRPAPGGLRISGHVAAPHRGRRVGGLPEPLPDDLHLGPRGLSRDGTVWPRSRVVTEGSGTGRGRAERGGATAGGALS